MFLNSIHRKTGQDAQNEGYPFDLPIIATLEKLEFEAPVTILVGENGCGKSTLLETIAAGMDCHTMNATIDPQTCDLASQFRFSRSTKPTTRFLFRAEDASIFARNLHLEQIALQDLEAEFDATLTGYGHRLATSSMRGQREALSNKYGEVPDARSHGEWFLTLLRERIHRPGLYVLDEPETPLSPIHELSLLSLVIEAVARGAQFIIATHSPMLMACPNANLLTFGETAIEPIAWQDVEHVKLLKSFLANPEGFLRHL